MSVFTVIKIKTHCIIQNTLSIFTLLSKYWFNYNFSEGSQASTTKKTGRKKITSTKQELPKIAEEKVSENVSSADTTDLEERKETRKRKKPVV